MAASINTQLLDYLSGAEAIEKQSLQLMHAGIEHAGDERIADVYRAHCRQTEEHIQFLAERIAAGTEGAQPRGGEDDGLAALAISLPARASSATLVVAAYAHENLEIAAYHLVRSVADRVGDQTTVLAVDHILEQEEAAAERLASVFDRALDVSSGAGDPANDPGRSCDG